MKKQINPKIKAHLLRGAFYLLLLLTVGAISMALSQSPSRERGNQRITHSAAYPRQTTADFGGAIGVAAPGPLLLSPKDLVARPVPPEPQLSVGGGLPVWASTYTFTERQGCTDFVPGTVDTGNHCDDCAELVPLPFPYQLYDSSFTSVWVGSNGNLSFGAVNGAFNVSCIPVVAATYTIGPYWTDQCTGDCFNVTCNGCGIFTSVSGDAPNRSFNIEWRTAYYNSGGSGVRLNYEVRLFEGQTFFDVIYETLNTFTPPNSRNLSVGVQLDTNHFTLLGCDPSGGQDPPVDQCTGYRYALAGASSPSPTPTSSPTATSTATPTATSTATATPTPTPSPVLGCCQLLEGGCRSPVTQEDCFAHGGISFVAGGDCLGSRCRSGPRPRPTPAPRPSP